MVEVKHGGENIEIIKLERNLERQEINRDDLVNKVPEDKIIDIYRDMVRTRKFDDKLKEMLGRGFSIAEHSTLGQEAGPVAACAALKPTDFIMPYHRGWAWAIGKGMDPRYLLAELLGKKTGYCGGKAGAHLGDYQLGILGRPGIQGAHIPITSGVGLSLKQQKRDEVCIAFFGEGASNSGNFHEGLNLAGAWKVPVIFFCENNSYSIFSSAEETGSVKDIGNRALGYGMPGYIVDGNDALAVYYVTAEAIKRAREGLGATLIEAKTYRWDGHNAIDKIHYGGYRPREEVDYWKERCPINLLEKTLQEHNILDKEQIDEIKSAAEREMEAAEEFAVDSPYPDREDYFTNVFVEKKEGINQ